MRTRVSALGESGLFFLISVNAVLFFSSSQILKIHFFSNQNKFKMKHILHVMAVLWLLMRCKAESLKPNRIALTSNTDSFLESLKIKSEDIVGRLFPDQRRLPLSTLLLLLLIVLGQQGSGQVLPLKVGDKLPDLLFAKLQKGERSDLKSQFLILDFWSTTCGTCVAKLPEIDSLNVVFKNKTRIIPITTDPLKRIEAFLKRRPDLVPLQLGSFAEDSLFSEIFPYRYLPHEVWIDAEGTYLGATESEFVNAFQINRVLKGKRLGDQKVDIFSFDIKEDALHLSFKPFYHGNGWLGNYIDGLRYAGANVRNGDATSRYSVSNASILQLYALATRSAGFPFVPKRRVISEDLIPILTFQKDDGLQKEWEQKHSYWYELNYPSNISDSLKRRLMLADLNTAFNMTGEMTAVADSVWILNYEEQAQLFLDGRELSADELVRKLDFFLPDRVLVKGQGLSSGQKFRWPKNGQEISKPDLLELLNVQGLSIKPGVATVQKFKLTKN